jgi:hypothetical protein
MPRSFTFRRRFEMLEDRRLLAGNVTAALVGTDLVIDGDAAANAISVVETANDGEFTITGLNDAGGTPTSINNGAPNGSATIAGVTGDIIVNLLAGDDSATLTSINHTGNLTIDAGAGNDTLAVGASGGAVSIGGGLTIHVGDDQNRVTLSHATVGGNFFVDAVGTVDSSVPNTYIVSDSVFQQNAVMQLGDRTGSIFVSRTTVGGRLELDNAVREPPGMGSVVNGYVALRLSDVIVSGSLKLQSWGSTLVTLDNTFVGQTASIECFSSYNLLQLRNSRVINNLTVSSLLPRFGHLGPSASLYDSLDINGIIVDGTLTSSTTGSVRVFYSNINDASFTMNGWDGGALIDTNIFGHLFFSLGGGDDVFNFSNSIVHGNMTVIHSRFHQAGPIDPVQRGPVDDYCSMSISSSQIGTLSITGGNETDVVQIRYSIIDQVFADMDLESTSDGNRAGSDLFEITGSIVSVRAILDGSGGFDLFRNNGSRLNGLSLANFEAF